MEQEEASGCDAAPQSDQELEEADLEDGLPGHDDELGDLEVQQDQEEEPLAVEYVGGPRVNLRCSEMLGPRMLDASGEAEYEKMADEDLWKHMSTPEKSGAKWMTECAAIDPQCRGTATNVWLQVQIAFCKQQQSVSQRENNVFLMLPDRLSCLYDEIDRILPSLEYCLAPKRSSSESGSSALRSWVAVSETSSSAKDPSELDRHAGLLYDWLDIKAASYIRMVRAWHAGGGLSFVALVHHRATQCFLYYGNSLHQSASQNYITLNDFQECIRKRHEIGHTGIGGTDDSSVPGDWS